MWQSDKKDTIAYLMKAMPTLEEHLGEGATKERIGSSGTLESAIRKCIRLGKGNDNKLMKIEFNSPRDRDLILCIYRDQYEKKHREAIDDYHKKRREAMAKGTDLPEEYTKQ